MTYVLHNINGKAKFIGNVDDFIIRYKNLGTELEEEYNDHIDYGTAYGDAKTHCLWGRSSVGELAVSMFENSFGDTGFFIHNILVSSERRRIGTRCLEGIKEICADLNLSFIALTSYPSAEGFWEKMHFKKLPNDIEETYWPNQEKTVKQFSSKFIFIGKELFKIY